MQIFFEKTTQRFVFLFISEIALIITLLSLLAKTFHVINYFYAILVIDCQMLKFWQSDYVAEEIRMVRSFCI